MKNFNFKFEPTILYFGLPMGLLGLGMNAEHLRFMIGVEFDFGAPFIVLGWLSFIYLCLHYLYWFFNEEVRQKLIGEWMNPFRRSFLPAVTLTGMLFILSLEPVLSARKEDLVYWLYPLVLFHLFLNFYLINGWVFDDRVNLSDHIPSWFILISGNFVSVISMMTLQPTNSYIYELSLLFFAAGLFLWLIFATTLVYRVVFYTQVQIPLRPSLFIFLAPPSLACVASMLISDSYINTGAIDESSIRLVGWLSYSFASIMLLAWMVSIRYFLESGLSMAGWSYVYPVAAYGLASQYMSEVLQNEWLLYWSIILFSLVAGIVCLLLLWLFKQASREKVEPV